MTYHWLIARHDTPEGKRWGVEFGDYDLETVRDEREDVIYSGDYKASDVRVISLTCDLQSHIDYHIKRLNRIEAMAK